MSSVARSCTEAALTANAKVFATIGSLIGNPIGCAISTILSLGFLAFLLAGAGDIEFEDELQNLWVAEGSRAEDENDSLEEFFGGSGRISLVTIHIKDGDDTPSSTSDPGILTREGLYAFGNLTAPLLDGTVGINETFKVSGVDTNLKFSALDFCDRPSVPDFITPWTAAGTFNQDPSLQSWGLTGKAGSGGLFYMSRCFAALGAGKLLALTSGTVTAADYVQLQLWFETYGDDMTTLLDADAGTKAAAIAARPGLPDGWGFSIFPCTRAHVHDCWNDGKFDTVENLVELEEYSQSMLVLFDSTGTLAGFFTGALDLWFTQCAGALTTVDLPRAFTNAGVPAGSIPGLITQISAGLTGAGIFLGAGYWWRPSIEDQASTLASSFFESLNNTANYDATTCVAEGLLRRTRGARFLDGTIYPTAAPAVSGATADLFTAINGGCCVNWGGTAITSNLFTGGLTPSDFRSTPTTDNRFAYTVRVSAEYMPVKSNFLNDRLKSERGIDAISEDEQRDLLQAWDKAWIDDLEPRHEREKNTGYADGETYAGFTPDFLVDRSIGDLLKDAAEIEAHLLIAGYITLIAFSMFNFVMWMCPPNKDAFVFSTSGACLVGILTVGLAVGAGFGLMAWLDIKLSPLNSMLVPFLAVGLGLDDVFVMLTDYGRHYNSQNDPTARMILTMADAGSSITVTSMANMVAFLMPTIIIRIPGVYTFGYQMGASVIINWFALIFLFGPMLYLDARRKAAGCSLGCIKAEGSERDVVKATDGRSLHHFIQAFLAPLYKKKPFKIFSIFVFLASTVVLGWYGFEESTEGLKLSDVALKGHYVRSFVFMLEDYYPILPGSLMQRTIDYTTEGQEINITRFQGHLKQFMTDTEKSKFIDNVNSPSSLHWVYDLATYYTSNGGTLDSGGNVPSGDFYSTMRNWLATDGALSLSNLVCQNVASGELSNCQQVDGITVKLVASRSSAYYVGINTDKNYVDAIEDIREKGDASDGIRERCCAPYENASAPFDTLSASAGDKIDPHPLFYTGTLFRYWQQYVGIQDTMLKAVGFSLLGVFGATLIFQFNPLSSIIVGVMLLAIVLQLYGFFAILGVKLNGFSVLNLAVCVGMGVELTAHLAYAYLRANAHSDDPDTRMELALTEMFPPMLAGSMTTFISVICLAFAKYPFFSLYFFQAVACMIALAFVNGMWFLPIILSIINPTGIDKQHRRESLGGGHDDDTGDLKEDKEDNRGL